MRLSKTQQILEHLQKYGSITFKEACELYGITWLAWSIWCLRKQYHIITVQNDRENDTIYILKGKLGERGDLHGKQSHSNP